MSAILFEYTGVTAVESPVSLVLLGGDDVPSTVANVMRRNADGSPVYSCERWLRLAFDSPVTQLRAWSDNYAPNPGWTVRYGIRSTYRAPSRSRSDTAIHLLPTADPGAANLMLTTSSVGTSAYLVLQATALVSQGSTLQASPLHLRFEWAYV